MKGLFYQARRGLSAVTSDPILGDGSFRVVRAKVNLIHRRQEVCLAKVAAGYSGLIGDDEEVEPGFVKPVAGIQRPGKELKGFPGVDIGEVTVENAIAI